jgi:hypothetical protein
MVLMLAMMLLPMAVAAEEPCDTCPSLPCALQVNIVTPTNGEDITVGDCFWVNAVVARPQGASQIAGVEATLTVSGPASISECSPTQGPFTLNDCNPMADLWWKVCCDGEGEVSLTVNAVSTTAVPAGCDPTGAPYAGASKTVKIDQVLVPCDPCIVVEIIECPEAPILPSTVFGVKALIHNVCDEMICGVDVTISMANIDKTTPAAASLLAGYSPTISLDCIYPGRYEEVGWTLHCDSGKDVKITVDAVCNANDQQEPDGDCDPCAPLPEVDPCAGRCIVQSDSCVVEQICPAALGVTITSIPAKVGANCTNCFDITAKVCETCGDTGINNITATLNISGDYKLDSSVSGNTLTKTVCPYLIPGECQYVTWRVCCTGDEDLTVSVTANGYDAVSNAALTKTTASKTVEQLETLLVEVLSPAEGTKYNVCEEFDVTFRVTNVTGIGLDQAIFGGINFATAANVSLARMTADIVYCPDSHLPPQYSVPVTLTDEGYVVPLNCVCACCYADVTFHLQCDGSGMVDCAWTLKDIINVFGMYGPTLQDAVIEDDDTVTVQQMCKAHLVGDVQVFEGTLGMDLEGCEPMKAVTPGESFIVVATVANLGEATANNVMVTLGWDGNAVTQMSPTMTISSIGCHGAAKLIWQFECEGEGEVDFWIESMSGTDANFEAPIHDSNMEKGCPVTIDQIPLTVEIIQPLTCTSFVERESFTVKARITNHSTTPRYILDGVIAELHWTTEAEGCDPCGDFELSGGPNPVDVTPLTDTLLPGESAEVTWQVKCCSAGDVTFWVDVAVKEGLYNGIFDRLDIVSGPETIHQWEPGKINIYIVSPKLLDYDLCWEYGDPEAYIATGQEFAVSAKLFNSSDRPFTVDALTLMAEGSPWGWNGDIEVLAGPDLPIVLAPHGMPGDRTIVSWDVVCTDPGKTDLEVFVSGVNDMLVRDSDDDEVTVIQYSAAHLVVDIIDYPMDPINLGDEFPVTARITNIGDADAWEAKAQISVYPEASAHVSANDQEGTYTKSLGNLIGHGVDESVEVTWLMRCKAVCDTTITVTAMGYDEFGYEVKQICTSELYGPMQITCCELLLDGTPGAAILDRFIEPASITVKQLDPDDPDGDDDTQPASGNHDILLGTGWNLVSSPWYVEPADRAPADLLVDILDNLEAAYGYAACGSAVWQTYIPYGPASLAQMRDGFGYWLKMTAPDTLSIVGAAAPLPPASMPEYAVCTGWNLIGVKNGEAAVSVDDYLAGTSPKVVYGYNNATGSYVQLTSGAMMQPGMGYWVAFLAPGTIYP